MSVLEVKNLSFAYEKDLVLKDINISINEREFIAIIGPNGGGKSTLLKLIMGELEPKSGEIKIFNKPSKASRELIGYVPQNVNVNLDFPIRVIDIVMMGNPRQHRERLSLIDRLFSMRYNDIEWRCAYSTLEQVGISNLIKRGIKELSGGQRQRAMIARALCAHPKILILDEPTSSIDFEGQKQIFKLLKELSSDLTVIVVSHDLSVISNYATKVIYLNRTSYTHNLKENPINLEHPNSSEHFCEVELMQLLSSKLDSKGE